MWVIWFFVGDFGHLDYLGDFGDFDDLLDFGAFGYLPCPLRLMTLLA